jgi:hypothetical protein
LTTFLFGEFLLVPQTRGRIAETHDVMTDATLLQLDRETKIIIFRVDVDLVGQQRPGISDS